MPEEGRTIKLNGPIGTLKGLEGYWGVPSAFVGIKLTTSTISLEHKKYFRGMKLEGWCDMF